MIIHSRLTVIAAALAASFALTACVTPKGGSNLGAAGGMNADGLVTAGATAFKAASLSDADVKTMSTEACATSDKQNKLAPAGSKYDARLKKVMKGFDPTINGAPINYRVYLTKDVNAWAMANGCIRVYSGLMDMMTDSELRGVIGHEMGHVALGHSKKAMQTAYTVAAARSAVGSVGNSTLATLSQSQLGELTEKVINAQFSQTQESAADDYSFDLLTKQKMDTKGLVTAFQKLAKLDGGGNASSMLSSHPSSVARAEHIQQRIDQAKK